MNFRKNKVGLALLASLAVAGASLLSGRTAIGGPNTENFGGTQAVYGNIPPDQIEFLSTGDRIKSVAAKGSMMEIWETLEHGERVECVECIPSVEPLLYDANPRTREIAAWWLRRRLFGVFGDGEVYQRTVQTLASDPSPQRRAYAANALGEFLAAPGVDACATAIANDADPGVRAAAATALGRLNDEGKGGISRALADADSRVKLAGLASAARINTFVDVPAVAKLAFDGDAVVRRRSAELLGGMRAKDSVDGLIALTKDADAGVRNAACHALGQIRDGRARATLEAVRTSDPDTLVRDQADMALRRL
ncbi:HEAT repeat protein [Labilithrix luteola]|uniref:HEAT repeat protein n=1 Tax=Labilithrix luteola TaxID=1391654 RepID=A0A0K1PSU9_9BACT|nr:HEAT repeat domain-containing protein [Labilithrix luteola]AKU96592.1 HEAT repeat protein [Labilithrix luteola]